jgi:NAD(P)H-hydrate repair Nnr-like enzyme with NAD(P)H-hydrate epimerase domain
MVNSGTIRCVDLVRDELSAREDEVCTWAKAQLDLFVTLTPDVQRAVREVLTQHQRIIGVGSGRSGADPFVIALAVVNRGVVVTEETASRNLTKPKIPDVCDAMGVRHLTLLGFVQEQGWVFR